MLTAPMKRCFDYIASEVQQKGVPPTYRAIRTAMGWRSPSYAFRIVAQLEERGKVRRVKGRGQLHTIELVRPPRPTRVQYFVFDDESKAFRPWTPNTGNQVKQA